MDALVEIPDLSVGEDTKPYLCKIRNHRSRFLMAGKMLLSINTAGAMATISLTHLQSHSDNVPPISNSQCRTAPA
jgi:hypothetical protein